MEKFAWKENNVKIVILASPDRSILFIFLNLFSPPFPHNKVDYIGRCEQHHA